MRPRAATSWRASRSHASFSSSDISAGRPFSGRSDNADMASSPFTGIRGDLPHPDGAPPVRDVPGLRPSSQGVGRNPAGGSPPDVTWPLVLVLLPPSETKSPGGSGAPL